MKALLCGVLCAGLLGQAPVFAKDSALDDAPDAAQNNKASDDAGIGIGHASVGWQQDDADGESTAFALALPLPASWYLIGSRAESDSQLDSLSGSDTVTATSTRFGLSRERDGWGGSLTLLRYDDDAVLSTDETQLILRHRGEQLEFGLEFSARSHDVFADMPEPMQDREASFDSSGYGLHLGFTTKADWRLFGGWQKYRYDDARVLDEDFGENLLERPLLYLLLMNQRDKADGQLVDHNLWLGFDAPLGKHLLTFEHAVSELEIDGGEFSSDTLILALNLGERWGVDLSAGISQSDETDDLKFAGLSLHLFW
jgi:hypothetical protein